VGDVGISIILAVFMEYMYQMRKKLKQFARQ